MFWRPQEKKKELPEIDIAQSRCSVVNLDSCKDDVDIADDSQR